MEKRKKKKERALGWWQKLSSGDPKKNAEIFNHLMGSDNTTESSGESSQSSSGETAMGEAIESILNSPENVLEAMYSLNNLDEAKFNTNTPSGEKFIIRHYDSHVLKPDEQFNYNDPKFPYMTYEQYMTDAEELSLQPAGRSDAWLPGHSDKYVPVIGYVEKTKGRCIKARHSKYMKGMLDVVVYQDTPGDDQIFSYMLQRKGKYFSRLQRDYADELPENK